MRPDVGWRSAGLAGSVRSVLGGVVLAAVHGCVWISVGAACLAVATMVLAGLPVAPLPVCLVFGATMVVYGVNRVADLAVDERNVPGRAAFTRTYGWPLLAVGAAVYLGGVGAAVARGVRGAALLWEPPLVCVLYAARPLRRRLLVKNVLVGVGWAAVPVGVGAYAGRFSPMVVVVAGVVAVEVTAAAVVFDVKDVPGDRVAGVRTVPTEFGAAHARRFATAASLAAAAGVVLAVATGVVPSRALVLVAYAGYVAAYSRYATPGRTPLFYGFVVDGEHAFLALAALVAA